MIKLKKSNALGRKIRQDDAADLAIPTWTLAREAIQGGRTDEALEFMSYGCAESKIVHDNGFGSAARLIDYIADTLGEAAVEKAWKHRPPGKWDWADLSMMEAFYRWVELHRGHFGGADMTVTEEPDRYVVKLDPCGTGGRIRRLRSVGTTKKAYPWSWSKIGVPYYCCHCAVGWEIIPIELRGYPLKVCFPGDTPDDPCIHYFYKKPELIPEEYFTRVGKVKTIK